MGGVKLRFVGGPLHGQWVVIREGESYMGYRVAVSEPPTFSAYQTPYDSYSPSMRYVTYSRRRVDLQGTVCEVMGLDGTSTAAFNRRLADIIEGV